MKQKLSNTPMLNICYFKIILCLHPRYHPKIIRNILKNVKKQVILSKWGYTINGNENEAGNEK